MIVEVNTLDHYPMTAFYDDKIINIQTVTNQENNMQNFEFKTLSKEEVLKRTLTRYECDILELADDMASAMTDLNAHNYKNFVDARDKFRDKLKEMCNHAVSSNERLERMKKVIAEL